MHSLKYYSVATPLIIYASCELVSVGVINVHVMWLQYHITELRKLAHNLWQNNEKLTRPCANFHWEQLKIVIKPNFRACKMADIYKMYDRKVGWLPHPVISCSQFFWKLGRIANFYVLFYWGHYVIHLFVCLCIRSMAVHMLLTCNDLDMLNTIKIKLAGVLTFSPSSEQRWSRNECI